MEPVIRLKDFIQEMDLVGDEAKAFLNIRTGEFVTLSIEDLGAAEDGWDAEGAPEWQQEVMRKAEEVVSSDDFKELPDKFEIDEYRIMESFCESREAEAQRWRLLDNIRGRGAFRRFKDTIYDLGIEEEWYRFRDQAFKEIAIGWLEGYQVAYTDEEG